MRVNRSMFVGLLALVTAVGMLGVNGYYWWLSKSRQTDSLDRSTLTQSSSSESRYREPRTDPVWEESLFGHSPNRELYREPDEDMPTRFYFPEYNAGREIAQADGLEETSIPAEKTPSDSVPPPLLMPESASPITEPPISDWLSELVKQEFPDATAEERGVWSQELRGLNPEMARDILRMRKSVKNAPTIPRVVTRPEPVPEFPLPEDPHQGGTDEVVPPSMDYTEAAAPSIAGRLRDSISALETARNVALNNLINIHTPGFKRMRVVLTERSYDTEPTETENIPPVAVGRGVAMSCTLLDVSQGDLQQTDQSLDVAIEGTGFFQVRVGEEIQYTRFGMWTLNEQGKLCIINAGKPCPLEPPIPVPKEFERVEISGDGTIASFTPGEATPHNAGQIAIVHFTNPSRLRPVGNQFYSATKDSGPPRVGKANHDGMGKLMQGFLELSNVSRNEELEQVQQLQTHLQLLNQLTASRPGEFLPGPVARRPNLKAKRTSAELVPIPPPALKSFLQLKDQSRNLIDEYLQGERVQSIQRTFGLK